MIQLVGLIDLMKSLLSVTSSSIVFVKDVRQIVRYSKPINHIMAIVNQSHDDGASIDMSIT